MTDAERKAIPPCLCYDPFMSFDEVVWFAIIELDLIDEGQEAANYYSKREVAQVRRFVAKHYVAENQV